ncbi:ATP-binding cassette domain-containing protein [Streptomyces sp. NPDC093225]|uniref:ATP-binding cassette domain-containing protein n=1 Tax=Streptomyces sp. NPDC093225 TaxID=3366034 RepID=UPI0038139DA7
MRLHGVGRRYGVRGPWVLRDVDLDLPAGALVRIAGDNGSGKSTLARIVAGVDAPTRGRVTGRPRTAYVPERFPGHLPFTAREYLGHVGRVHGLSGAGAAREGVRWLERLGAGGHAGTPLRELSKGSSQKVALAQAFLARPGLLVLDEAWTGLDRAARDTVDQAVRERVADGATVVFVDHNPGGLAGAPHTLLRVSGLRVTGTSVGPAEGAPGPRVTVLAQHPEGAGAPPPPLPGAPSATRHGDRHRFRVAARDSDALLRALLTADPPWHVHEVTAPEEADRGLPGATAGRPRYDDGRSAPGGAPAHALDPHALDRDVHRTRPDGERNHP